MRMARSAWLVAVLGAFSLSVAADPPPWAPAHGWRRQHDPYYVGYTGKKWERDYGVLEGTCNTAAVGAVLGGAVGGAVGASASNDRNRPIAIVVGSVIGSIIGAKIGADIDASDRACFGHALELAGEGRTVVWTNAATGVRYRLTPTRNLTEGDRPCREFTALVSRGRKEDRISGVACRGGDGQWTIRG